jgi:CHAD domain-containing protein
VKQTLERELKLDVGSGFRLPRLPGRPLPPRVFASTYYDTPDHRLAGAGVTARRRTARGRHRWQVKLPQAAGRLELELPGSPIGPPEELRRLLTVYTRGAPLVAVATLRTRRSGVLVRERGKPVAEVMLDAVAVLDGRRVKRRFREVEIELVGEGDEGVLGRLGAALRAHGATEGDARPKVFRALGFEVSIGPASTRQPGTPLEHVLAALRAQLDAVRARDPGTRLGTDPEELHQMRVATRRLRAILRAARPMLVAARVSALREELAWLGATLGARRDLDVLRDHLRAEVRTLDAPDRRVGTGLLRRLDRARDRARAELLAGLDSPRYLALLDHLERMVADPPAVEADVTLWDLGARAFGKLRRTVRGLPEVPTDADLHAVRIKAKRARYAAELAAAEVGCRAQRFVDRVKRLQDVLGVHQDAVVAEAHLRALAGEAGDRTGFVAGLLVERQRARRQAARATFAAWWPKVERHGRKVWR